MRTPKCRYCEKESSVHISGIENGNRTEEHFCAAHYREPECVTRLNYFVPGPAIVDGMLWYLPHSPKGFLEIMRGVRHFLGAYGRLPSAPREVTAGIESKGEWGLAKDLNKQALDDIQRLDRLIRLMESSGLMPLYTR